MCHPAAFMIAAVVQQQQAQQAEDAQVRAMNQAAEENAQRQTEAYQNDMASAYAEEINIEEEGFKSAEDAADAKLALLVEARETQASLRANNFETIGGGQTADAIIANHRRAVSNNSRDLEDNFQRGVTSRRKEREGIGRDRISRRMSYKSALNSMPTSGFASQGSRMLGIGGAAFQGYAAGKSYTKVTPSKSSTKPRSKELM